jgi:hypothetical protein
LREGDCYYRTLADSLAEECCADMPEGMCKQTVVDIVWDYHLVYFLGLGELPFSGLIRRSQLYARWKSHWCPFLYTDVGTPRVAFCPTGLLRCVRQASNARTLTVSLAVRRIGDTGIFTNQHIRPTPGVPPFCQHESHSLDGSHKPLSAENAKLGALADFPACCLACLAGCRCVI